MDNKKNFSLIKALLASFPSRLTLAHTTLEQLKLNEALSPTGLLNVKTIELCHRHMNQLCKLIDYLVSDKSTTDSFHTDSFDAEDLFSGITSAFSKILEGYSSATAVFCSKLNSPHPVQVNKTRFETIILNILYSCLKTSDFSASKQTKLTMSVSETKKNIVFHIRTNTESSASDLVERILADSDFQSSDIYAQDSTLALSLKVASEFAKESEGSLSYKTLKYGNRYDLSLPKFPAGIRGSLASSVTYFPSYELFEDTFAEFKLLALSDTFETDVHPAVEIPAFVSKVISKLKVAGHEAHVVGGCVRDSIIGKSPSDWDLTTSALPDEILSVFKNQKVIETGIKHGTVTVFSKKQPVEITTYRIDGEYLDNRRPEKVTFSGKLTDDLMRRDFTINAMAYNPETGICDPFGGTRDIESKLIRAVGNATKRFSEDALRIMRAIRFSATLGFEIESETKRAIFECKDLLTNISTERITEEFTKTLTTPSPAEMLAEYFAVTSEIFFGCSDTSVGLPSKFKNLDNIFPNIVPRLAAYLFFASKALDIELSQIAATFFSRMKFSSAIKKSVISVVNLFSAQIPTEKIPLRKMLSEASDFKTIEYRLQIQEALEPNNPHTHKAKELFDQIISNKDCCKICDLEISGSDLIQEFGLSGSEIGIAQNMLLNAVIEEKCQNNKPALIQWFKNTFSC